MIKLYLFLVSCFMLVAASATNYYVDAVNGNNGNSGLNTGLAKSTIQAASNLTNPGDTVFIMNGLYTASTTITTAGAANQYITYKPYPGTSPLIYISGNIWNAIIVNASYIVLQGLELKGDNDNITYTEAYNAYTLAYNGGSPNGKYNTNGISIGGPNTQSLFPNHVTIRNCKIHDFPGGGLSSIQADYTTIEGNTVYNNAWYMMYAGSGISILTPVNSDAPNVNLYKNIVRNNIVYGNKTTIPWVSLNPPALSDGNGIIIDVNQYGYSMAAGSGTEYNGRTLVENNVTFNNGGSGIHAYKADHVDIINNTAFGNGTVVGYADIYGASGTDIKIFNNIMYSRTGGKCNNAPSTGTTVTYDYNVYYNGTVNAQGLHDVIANPLFVNPSTNGTIANFSLLGASPAVNAGSNSDGQFSASDIVNVARPVGARPDMGAYEFTGVATPLASVIRNVMALSVVVGNPGTPSRPYPVSLSEYSSSTGSATGVTVAIPGTTVGNRLLLGGNNPLEGQLNLSGDGRYLTFGGYDVDAGVSIGIAYTSPKVIARVNFAGTVDLTTQIPATVAFGNTSVRSVVSQDGSAYWVTGGSSTGTTNGIQYLTHGATNATTPIYATGNRSLGIFKNVLYADNSGIGAFAGLPVTAASPVGGNGSYQAAYPNNTQFVFLDTDPGYGWNGTGYDVLYIADAVSSGANLNAGVGINKFYVNSSGNSWIFAGGVPYDVTGSSLAIPAITGAVNNVGKPVLYAIQGNALNNSIISITDAGGRTNAMSAANTTVTTLASAGTNNIFRGIAFSPSQFSLPVNLSSFSGALVNGGALLQWITKSELNAGNFDIERSGNGVTFTKIGTVAAKNESLGSTYSFEEAGIANGIYYYRLKLVNKDGSYTYSTTIAIKKDGKAVLALHVFPNPATDYITISHPKAATGALLQIVTVDGKKLMQYQVAANATQTSMNITSLKTGKYFLLYINKESKSTIGFIK